MAKLSSINKKDYDSRINSFNMSCGPEGLFIIDKDDRIINSYISKLTFEKEIIFSKESSG